MAFQQFIRGDIWFACLECRKHHVYKNNVEAFDTESAYDERLASVKRSPLRSKTKKRDDPVVSRFCIYCKRETHQVYEGAGKEFREG